MDIFDCGLQLLQKSC